MKVLMQMTVTFEEICGNYHARGERRGRYVHVTGRSVEEVFAKFIAAPVEIKC